MVQVVGIDHLVIRVSDYAKSKAFYGKLFAFLGFEVSDEFPEMIGWTNGKNAILDRAGGRQGPSAQVSRGVTSGSTTTHSSFAAARTSMRCRPSCRPTA